MDEALAGWIATKDEAKKEKTVKCRICGLMIIAYINENIIQKMAAHRSICRGGKDGYINPNKR